MQKRVTSAKQKRQKLINERLAHRSVQGPAAQASEVTIVTKEASGMFRLVRPMFACTHQFLW